MATVRTRLGPADNGRVMTLDEYSDADVEEGYRYELARGVVEVTNVPNDPHGQVVSNLHGAFHYYKKTHLGVIRRIGGGSEFQLWIPELVSGRNPDLAVAFHGTPKDGRGRRPPRLVAEVVSARGAERDYRLKREEYWVHGLLEYWIVDPSLRRVTVLLRRDHSDWVEVVFEGDALIVGDLIPDLEVTVAELWDNADLDEPDED